MLTLHQKLGKPIPEKKTADDAAGDEKAEATKKVVATKMHFIGIQIISILVIEFLSSMVIMWGRRAA